MSKCGHIAEFFKPSFEVLINHKEEWNYVIFRKLDGTGDHHVYQVSHVHKDQYHMFSLILKFRPKKYDCKMGLLGAQ
jgi:hypothetical protein